MTTTSDPTSDPVLPPAPAPAADPADPAADLPVLDVQTILNTAMMARLETRWVHVPEWGGRVEVRELSRGEILRITKAATDPRTGLLDEGKMQRGLFCTAVTKPRFAGKDYDLLMNTSSRPLGRVLEVIRELLGTRGTGEEEDAVAAEAASFRAG